MAQSKRQKKLAARDKRDARKFATTTLIVTGILLVLLYVIYSQSA